MRITRKLCSSLLILGGLVVLNGCSTLRSNLYAPDESGVRAPLKLKGMPVTVEVPTHLQVTLTETHYYTEDKNKLVPIQMRPSYELAYKPIMTKELYTTDFKRPPSGSNNLKLVMSTERDGVDGNGPKKRYFNKINQDTVDTTLVDVAALVQAVINKSPLLFTAKGTSNSNAAKANDSPVDVKTVTITVASEVFDVRQPDLEGRIQAFYDEHLNRCAARCGTLGESCPAPGITPVVTQLP